MPFLAVLLRVIGIALGVTLIGVGVPLFVMPIPLGLIFIALGILLLIISSTHAAKWVRGQRTRHPKFDARLRRIEDGLPGFIRGVLTTTRPA